MPFATMLRIYILTLVFCFAAAPKASAQFVNATADAGVVYTQHRIVDPPKQTSSDELLFHQMRFMTGGAAVADFDDDGWLDLVVTRLDDTDLLFKNDRDGSFSDVSALMGLTANLPTNGAVWFDADNDGDQDLFMTVLVGDRPLLYINDDGENFTEEALDRNADLDAISLIGLYSASAGDYNNDGRIDLLTNEWSPIGARSYSRLLQNLGGSFSDVTQQANLALMPVRAFSSGFADLDNDGWVDLAIAADFGTSRLFWNRQDGNFDNGTEAANVGTDENGMGSAIGDYDNDGDLDWFVTSIFDTDGPCQKGCNWGATGNRLFRNDGNRTFTDVTDAHGVRDGGWGWGALFFDYDNDGDLDLVMTNGQSFLGTAVDDKFNNDQMRLWRNDGPGLWPEVATTSGLTDARSGKGLLTFDYDNDGDLDLFATNNGDTPTLYRNDIDNGYHWLRVSLEGSTSNRNGYGARVYVTADVGGPRQMRELRGGSHFLGQSENVAHFGLGDHAETIAQVCVFWPATTTSQTFTGVAVDQHLKVVEGDGGVLGDGCQTATETMDAGVADAGVPDASVVDAGGPDANVDASPSPNHGQGGCAVRAVIRHDRTTAPLALLMLAISATRFRRRS